MVQINFAKKEINCKIVYYGPGMSGKTTNLEVIHKKVPAKNKGDLTSISTEGERTLFFDFLPLDLGTVNGMNTKFQIYTVPGQVYYSSTRRLVLQGVDGIVFVADSQRDKLEENIESIKDLKENLSTYSYSIDSMPLLIQYNKRDLKNIFEIDFLEKNINKLGSPYVEAVASSGDGVIQTIKTIAKLVLDNINSKNSSAGSHVKREESHDISEGDKPDDCIFSIDNEKISKKDFNIFCLTQDRLSSKIASDAEENSNKRYKDMYINYFLVAKTAMQKKVEITGEELNEQVKQYSLKLGSFDRLLQYLKKRDLSMEELKKEIKRNLLTSKLLKLYFPDYKRLIDVNSNEISEYFESNKDRYKDGPDKSRALIIKILKKKKKDQLLSKFFKKLREKSNIQYY